MAVITLANWLATRRRRRRSCDCLLNVCVQRMLPHIAEAELPLIELLMMYSGLCYFCCCCCDVLIELTWCSAGSGHLPVLKRRRRKFLLSALWWWPLSMGTLLSFLIHSVHSYFSFFLFSTLVVGCYHSFCYLPSSFMNHTRTAAAAVLTFLSFACWLLTANCRCAWLLPPLIGKLSVRKCVSERECNRTGDLLDCSASLLSSSSSSSSSSSTNYISAATTDYAI